MTPGGASPGAAAPRAKGGGAASSFPKTPCPVHPALPHASSSATLRAEGQALGSLGQLLPGQSPGELPQCPTPAAGDPRPGQPCQPCFERQDSLAWFLFFLSANGVCLGPCLICVLCLVSSLPSLSAAESQIPHQPEASVGFSRLARRPDPSLPASSVALPLSLGPSVSPTAAINPAGPTWVGPWGSQGGKSPLGSD